jgi:hypothetical protein
VGLSVLGWLLWGAGRATVDASKVAWRGVRIAWWLALLIPTKGFQLARWSMTRKPGTLAASLLTVLKKGPVEVQDCRDGIGKDVKAGTVVVTVWDRNKVRVAYAGNVLKMSDRDLAIVRREAMVHVAAKDRTDNLILQALEQERADTLAKRILEGVKA